MTFTSSYPTFTAEMVGACTNVGAVTTASVTFTHPCHVWLGNISYRPGWSFEIGYCTMLLNTTPPTLIELRITAKTVESNSLKGDTTLTHVFALHSDVLDRLTENEFYDLIFRHIEMVERHEMREFYKINGVRHVDPHRDDNRHLYD